MLKKKRTLIQRNYPYCRDTSRPAAILTNFLRVPGELSNCRKFQLAGKSRGYRILLRVNRN